MTFRTRPKRAVGRGVGLRRPIIGGFLEGLGGTA